MAYSRWGGSNWYAFYNCNGKLSLWAFEKTTDWEAEDLKDITEQDIMVYYGCGPSDAKEAMKYIGYFLEDYVPNDPAVIEYRRQEAEFLESLKKAEESND
jgi:hypothetical protein